MKQLQSFVFVMALAVAASSSAAEPITVTNKNGVVYKNITVIRKDRDGILFRSEAGGGRLKAVDMGEELQTRFGFDPATVGKIAQEEKQKAIERDRAFKEEVAQTQAALAARTQENATLGPIRYGLSQASRVIKGKVLQHSRKGGVIIFSGADEWKTFVEREIAAGRDPQPSDYPNDSAKPGDIFVGQCYLINHPSEKALADGSLVGVKAYPSGTQAFEGTTKITTLPRFDCDLEGLVRAKARSNEK